jgi:regulator of sigma E protease
VANPVNPVVGALDSKGAAAKAGLLEGDRIVEVDGKTEPTYEYIRRKEVVGIGKAMQFVVERGGARLNFDVTPLAEKTQGGAGSTGWEPQTQVQIASFGPDAPSQKAGLEAGDIFVSFNGQPIRTGSGLVAMVEKSAGAPIRVAYLRDGKPGETTVSAVRVKDPEGTEHWRIGAALQSQVEFVQLPVGAAIAASWHENRESAMMLYRFLQGLIEQRMSPKSIDGPLGIARLSGEAARRGPLEYLQLMAMVSLNLAVVNMLPIPLLDEMLMQRDLSMRVKEGIMKVGFAFLMVVIVFVIYNDISKALPGG